jgi:hypothetical protein
MDAVAKGMNEPPLDFGAEHRARIREKVLAGTATAVIEE